MSPRSETAAGNIDSVSIPKQYCAQVSANCNEDPIGSAPGHHTYLLVEVPLPWHHQVEQSVHFPNGLNDLLQQAAGRGRKFRFLSFASDMLASPRGWRRVISYRKAGSPFARFCKKEYIVPEQAVNGLAEALLEDRSAVSFDEYEVHTGDVRDLFVCTHGSHDVCCGKFGYPMYKEIEQRYTDVEDANVRVWRTSHFGGHRHAPTLLELPDGRYWAQLKPELLDALLLRKGDVRQLSRHYRGWSGLSAFEQVAERAAFMEQGWAWDRYEKVILMENKDDQSAIVALNYHSPERMVQGQYVAHVRISHTVVLTGGCGHGPGEAKQYELVSWDKSGGL